MSLDKIKEYVGLHHWSTYMLILGVIPVAILTHPSLFAMLDILAVLAWQFITREVSRFEVSKESLNLKCIGINVGLLLLVIFLMTRVTWIAL